MKRFFLLLPASAMLAAFTADQDTARQAVQAGRFKPLAEILAAVQARYPGRVLDVELDRNRSGRNIYEVKLLSVGGERQEIHIDAMTGEEVAPEAPLRLLPAAELLRQALAQQPGRVVDLDLRRHQERYFYQIRIMDEDGRSHDVFVDAQNGEAVAEFDHLPAGMKPLADLLDALHKNHSGHVLEVELKYDRNARPFYEIDLQQDDGTLTEISLDPFSGRPLSEDEIEVR